MTYPQAEDGFHFSMIEQVFFDFDSTLVTVEGIDELARFLGKPEVAKITSQSMEGKLNVKEAYSRRLSLLQLSEEHLELLAKVYLASLTPGARDLVRILKALGKEIGIISGGFQLAIEPVALELGIEVVEAVKVDFQSGIYGKVLSSDLLQQGGKAKVVQRLKKGSCAFIGDGITDLETSEVVQKMIPFAGVVRRSFIKNCPQVSYAGANLLGVLGFLLQEDELTECSERFPQETRIACDLLLQEENILGASKIQTDVFKAFATRRTFLPGPTALDSHSPARQYPMIGHRSPEFSRLFCDVQNLLHEFLGWEGKFLIGNCSGTGMMEAVLASLSRGKILSVQSGDFSRRWAQIANVLGYDVEVLEAGERRGVSPSELGDSDHLNEKDVVLITHSETSNATLNPVTELAQYISMENSPLVLVDGISSIGGIELDVRHVDGVVFCSQKCLAVAPGLGFLWVSERLEKEIRLNQSSSYYLDLNQYLQQHEKGNVPYTPAIAEFQALRIELTAFLKNRKEHFQRYRDMAQMVWDFARETGLEIYAEEGFRSLSVSCLRNPEGIDPVKELESRGYVVAAGYGALKKSHFRIGHMGRVQEADLKNLLGTLKEIMKCSKSS